MIRECRLHLSIRYRNKNIKNIAAIVMVVQSRNERDAGLNLDAGPNPWSYIRCSSFRSSVSERKRSGLARYNFGMVIGFDV